MHEHSFLSMEHKGEVQARLNEPFGKCLFLMYTSGSTSWIRQCNLNGGKVHVHVHRVFTIRSHLPGAHLQDERKGCMPQGIMVFG
jgi:hypothetical protein